MDDVRDGSGRFKPGIGKGKGIGGPANGAGWGGAKKGAHEAKPVALKDFYMAPPNPDRRAVKAARSAEMEDVLYDIAKNAEEHGTVRVQAAGKLYEMYNGKPVERVIVDEQPIERDYIDPNELSPEAREELRGALERQKLAEDDAKRAVN